jgi:hypothetical protein
LSFNNFPAVLNTSSTVSSPILPQRCTFMSLCGC